MRDYSWLSEKTKKIKKYTFAKKTSKTHVFFYMFVKNSSYSLTSKR